MIESKYIAARLHLLKNMPESIKSFSTVSPVISAEQAVLRQISDRALRHSTGISLQPSSLLSRAVIVTLERDSNVRNTLFGPGVCLVTQGTKRFSVGDHQLVQSQGDSLATLTEIPANHCRFETAGDRPYVAVGIIFSPEILSELLKHIDEGQCHETAPGFSTAASNLPLLEAWDRYLELLDCSSDIPALAEPRERELLYRLLQSPHGNLLRQFVHAKQAHKGIRRAIEMIRHNLNETISSKVLADIAGMSVPSFNRHFKSATLTSPLKYQKMLRLQSAKLLLKNNPSVSSAAYAVGYTSPSQFSREYTRYFGVSPKKDALQGSQINPMQGIF